MPLPAETDSGRNTPQNERSDEFFWGGAHKSESQRARHATCEVSISCIEYGHYMYV